MGIHLALGLYCLSAGNLFCDLLNREKPDDGYSDSNPSLNFGTTLNSYIETRGRQRWHKRQPITHKLDFKLGHYSKSKHALISSACLVLAVELGQSVESQPGI
jgi:hypothetical protein